MTCCLLGVLGIALAVATPAVQAGGSGRFEMAWSVTDAGGDPLSCRQAGADEVEVLATSVATRQAYSAQLKCKAGEGATDALPLGDYSVVVSLLPAGSGEPIAQSQPRSATLAVDGATVDLGSFQLQTNVGW